MAQGDGPDDGGSLPCRAAPSGDFSGKAGEMLAGAGSAITRIRARYRLKRPSVAFFPYFPDCFPEKSPLLHSTARERSPAARPSVAAVPESRVCI